MRPAHSKTAIVVDDWEGQAHFADGALHVQLVPKGFGGRGKVGATNPEQYLIAVPELEARPLSGDVRVKPPHTLTALCGSAAEPISRA